jgi:hypothetical protein
MLNQNHGKITTAKLRQNHGKTTAKLRRVLMAETDESKLAKMDLPGQIVEAMAQIDPDELLNSPRYKGTIPAHHSLRLGYFPALKEICGTWPITSAERAEKQSKEKEALWRYEQGESARFLRDRGMKHLAKPKSAHAWKELYLELKKRECVVDEYYRKRYENEIAHLRKQNDALRQYIGRYNPERKYPEPIDLERALKKYFKSCDKKGKKDGHKYAYTIPDMLLFLRITKSQWKSLLENGPHDYQVLAEMAMLKIEGQRNRQLLTGKGQMSGHIADLNHHFDWDDKKDRGSDYDRQPQVTNNIMLMGAPPQPKSIEEWTRWYQQSMNGELSPEALPEGEENIIDVASPKATPAFDPVP